MASGDGPGPPPLLQGNDVIDEKLLWMVANCVIYDVIRELARDVGIDDARFSRIVAQYTEPEEQAIKVIWYWYETVDRLRVGHLVDKLITWYSRGWMDTLIWERLGSRVKPELFANRIPPPPPPSAPSGGQSAKISPERGAEIRGHLSVGLRRRCQNYMSNDWLPLEKAKKFPLRDYYTELTWEKKVKRALRDNSEQMKRVHEIFKVGIGAGSVTIAVKGPPGVGKSSSLAMLCMDWVQIQETGTSSQEVGGSEAARPKAGTSQQEVSNELSQFSFVFLTELRKINDNSSLESIIMKQNNLRSKNITEEEMGSVLQGDAGKVLVLFDGYDEYARGTNDDVDMAFEEGLHNCFLILTSRDGDYISCDLLATFDGEVTVTGFSAENIQKCAGKYLESEVKAKDMIDRAREAQIGDFLSVPILLLMICILYEQKKELPNSQTELVGRIVQCCVDRSALKHFGKSRKTLEGLDQMLNRLAELAWRCFRKPVQQLLMPKEDILAISPRLLKLGLLQGTLDEDEATLEETPDWLMFPHKIFQEYWAAKHASRILSEENSQVQISDMFDLDKDVASEWNLVKFTCELLGGTTVQRPLVARVCQTLVETDIRSRFIPEVYKPPGFEKPDQDFEGFQNLRELFFGCPNLPLNLFNNEFICCLNKYKPKVGYPMRYYYHNIIVFFKLYEFKIEEEEEKEATWHTQWNMSQTSQHAPEMTPCAIVLSENNESGVFVLLALLSQQNQPVELLHVMMNLKFLPRDPFPQSLFTLGPMGYKPEPVYPKPKSFIPLRFHTQGKVILIGCDFQKEDIRIIVDSIEQSSTLERLNLFACAHIPGRMLSKLGQMDHLTHLMVCNCIISMATCLELTAQVKNLRSLEHVDVSYLRVEDVGHLFALIAISLSTIRPLKSANLGGCQLTTKLCSSLLRKFAASQLEDLKLDDNDLVGCMTDISRDTELVFENLRKLSFFSCCVSNREIQALEEMIEKDRLPKLEFLDLRMKIKDGVPEAMRRLLRMLNRKRNHQKCDVLVMESDHLGDLDYDWLKQEFDMSSYFQNMAAEIHAEFGNFHQVAQPICAEPSSAVTETPLLDEVMAAAGLLPGEEQQLMDPEERQQILIRGFRSLYHHKLCDHKILLLMGKMQIWGKRHRAVNPSPFEPMFGTEPVLEPVLGGFQTLDQFRGPPGTGLEPPLTRFAQPRPSTEKRNHCTHDECGNVEESDSDDFPPCVCCWTGHFQPQPLTWAENRVQYFACLKALANIPKSHDYVVDLTKFFRKNPDLVEPETADNYFLSEEFLGAIRFGKADTRRKEDYRGAQRGRTDRAISGSGTSE